MHNFLHYTASLTEGIHLENNPGSAGKSLQFAAEQQAVSTVEQAGVNALVGGGRHVQLMDGAVAGALFGLRLQYSTVVEGVIDGDDAADPQQLQTGLVVGGVALLVGVDKGVVERS